MSTEMEIKTYFGRCRCCLDLGYLKNMWTTFYKDGESEVYGEMLAECFDIAWERSEEMDSMDWICEACVTRVRDCCHFKRQVLHSHDTLLQQLHDDSKLLVCVESELPVSPGAEADAEVEAEEADFQEIEFLEAHDTSGDDDINSLERHAPVKRKAKSPAAKPHITKLHKPRPQRDKPENDESVKDESVKHESEKGEPEKDESVKAVTAPARVRSERAAYRQYTVEELACAVLAVRSGEMGPGQAAALYRVPRKTLHYKLSQPPDLLTEVSRKKTHRFLVDISAVLTLSNVTPFRSKSQQLHCFYCGTRGPEFQPRELRAHTRSQHENERVSNLERCMKPLYFNEILKVDVADLQCSACAVELSSWDKLLAHLKQEHATELTEGSRRIIPYVVESRERVVCGVCGLAAASVPAADAHADRHYGNHVCGACGLRVASLARLSVHARAHTAGRYPCQHCDRVFAHERYRRTHVDYTHLRLAKLKCHHCELRFPHERARSDHALEVHPELAEHYVCPRCGAVFTLKNSYSSHLKRHRLAELP